MPDVKEKLAGALKLLDDESAEIQKIVQNQLYENALEIVINRDGYRSQLDKTDQIHFDNLLGELHLEITTRAFKRLLDNAIEDVDLESAVLIISYWSDPTINCTELKKQIDAMSLSISADLPKIGHPLGFIDHINEYLFHELGIQGNSADYYNPENSFLHKLIQTRKGIPITIGILYMLISSRLGLPIYGVPLPGHFILKFFNEEDEIFFDPFYNGKIYSRRTCYRYLQNVNVENQEKILNGCSNLDIITRVLKNLQLVYSSYQYDSEKIVQIELFLETLQSYYVNQT